MKNFALLRDSDYLEVLNDAVESAEELARNEQRDEEQPQDEPMKTSVYKEPVAEAGLEPPSKSLGIHGFSSKSGAESDADLAQNDAERALLSAWRSADRSARLEALSVLRGQSSRLET